MVSREDFGWMGFFWLYFFLSSFFCAYRNVCPLSSLYFSTRCLCGYDCNVYKGFPIVVMFVHYLVSVVWKVYRNEIEIENYPAMLDESRYYYYIPNCCRLNIGNTCNLSIEYGKNVLNIHYRAVPRQNIALKKMMSTY